MRKLFLLVLALVLLIPSPARAAPTRYTMLNTTCEEVADRPGIYDIRSSVDMWTDRERYTRMIVIYEEYRDYDDGEWLLYRQTRDIAYRSTGEVVDGWFHHSGSYATRFNPTDYDVRLDYSIWWRGRSGFANNYGTIAKKRDGGRCFAKSGGEPPPGL
jgi:hypothetical protein